MVMENNTKKSQGKNLERTEITYMREKDYIRWSKTRKMGKLIFSSIYTIGFTLAVSAMPSIVSTFIDQKSWITFEKLLPEMLARAPYALVIGLILSQMVWRVNEKKFGSGCEMCSGNQTV